MRSYVSPRKFRSLELFLAGIVLVLLVLLGLPVVSGEFRYLAALNPELHHFQ